VSSTGTEHHTPIPRPTIHHADPSGRGSKVLRSAKLSQKVIQSDFVIAFTVRDGRITRYRLFEDSDAVHAAAWPD
jgi:ketosteroid isomerase-like protein